MPRTKHFITSLDEIPLFVDVPYLCELFQLTPDSIRKKLQSGSIKGAKIGANWRIPKSEIIRIYNDGGVYL